METAQGIDLNKLEKAAFILKTIAHPTRLAILELLGSAERLSVNEICDILGAEQSLTSHHLTGMKLKGILDCKREGKNIFYSLKMRETLNVLACIEKCDAL